MNGKLFWNKLILSELPDHDIQLRMPAELYGWTDVNEPRLIKLMYAAIGKQLDKQGLPWYYRTTGALKTICPFPWTIRNQVVWGPNQPYQLYTTFTIYLNKSEDMRKYHQVLGKNSYAIL
jgi:hypothetical protein